MTGSHRLEGSRIYLDWYISELTKETASKRGDNPWKPFHTTWASIVFIAAHFPVPFVSQLGFLSVSVSGHWQTISVDLFIFALSAFYRLDKINASTVLWWNDSTSNDRREKRPEDNLSKLQNFTLLIWKANSCKPRFGLRPPSLPLIMALRPQIDVYLCILASMKLLLSILTKRTVVNFLLTALQRKNYLLKLNNVKKAYKCKK